VKSDIDYAKITLDVFLAANAAKAMKQVGLPPSATTTKILLLMGEPFDPAKPEEYAGSFTIMRSGSKRGSEPPPVCRRPFGLSYAARAGWSSMA